MITRTPKSNIKVHCFVSPFPQTYIGLYFYNIPKINTIIMTSIHNPNTPPSVAVPITNEDSAVVQRYSDVPILHQEDEQDNAPSRKGKKTRVKQWMKRQWKEIFYEPKGVRLRHYFIVKWLGRIGFIAKGIVYAVMGGLCIRTAQDLVGDITGTESPMVCCVIYPLPYEELIPNIFCRERLYF